MTEKVLLWMTVPRLTAVLCCAAACRMLYEYLHRKKHRLAACLLGSGSGILLLSVLHFACSGIWALPLTAGTAGIAGVGGIPGVLLIVLLQWLDIQ